jgi:hypothetical protein
VRGRLGGLVFCGLCGILPARADPPAPAAVFSVERHFTTNALDSDLAISDFYTLLRGTLQRTFERPTGHVRLAAEFNATKYDHVGIEDDRAVALSAEVYDHLTPKLEMRGTISYTAASEGDDLPIGALHLGVRALKQIVALNGQAGIDLGHGYALVLEAGQSFEATGATHFEAGLLAPARLDPDRGRTRLSASLKKAIGRFSVALNAGAERAAVEKLGMPPVGVSYDQYTLTGDLEYKSDTLVVGLAAGAQFMRAADDLFTELRPAYRLYFKKSWADRLELRGSIKAAFEIDDSDDPLASWLRRGELETAYRFTERLKAAAGLFAQVKENLLLENRERSNGFYLQAVFARTPRFSVVVRADFSDTFATILDTRRKVLDIHVGMRGKI